PAGPVCVAVNVCSRSANGSSGIPDQLPPSSTSTTRTTLPSPSTTVTVDPGSPVPVSIGLGLFVTVPSAGPVMTGASGASVSTVTVTELDTPDSLPAWSVCVAVNVYSRSSNGSSGVPDQNRKSVV